MKKDRKKITRKKVLAMLMILSVVCSLGGCMGGPSLSEKMTDTTTETVTQTEAEEEEMTTIHITIGERTFDAALYDNETAKSFVESLPMTVNMSELNGNEKYYYLPDSLSMRSETPGQIQAGDLMLFGSDCLVLFYETFSTSYSYTPLGRIGDPSGLAEVVGSGDVEVTFALQ